MKSSFNTKRFFKDNNHYNVQFGCIGDAFFRAISILWTEEAIFEVEHQFTIYDVDSEENNTSNQIETRHFEINYCLKNIVYSYDYMNCLIRFIDAPGSNHPEATIRDFIAAMKSPNMNAKNNISYCIREKVECVSFSLISSHFIETVLFCSYVYWIIRYLMNNDKKYKKYALYFVDELCEQSGLDRKYAKEHHLFKLFEPMLNTFWKEFNNPIKSNFETVSSSGEQEVSEEHVSNGENEEEKDPFQKAIYEIAELDYNTSQEKSEKYIQYKYEWYYVMRATVELGVVTSVNAYTEFINLLPNDISKKPSKAILSAESSVFGNERKKLLAEQIECVKKQEMKQERFNKGLDIAKKFSKLYESSKKENIKSKEK